MAELNQAAADTSSNTGGKKVVTHFINLSIVQNAEGDLLPLGAIPIYENPNKTLRTLLKAIEDGFDISKLVLQMDVRKNEKSTDVGDYKEWQTFAVKEED